MGLKSRLLETKNGQNVSFARIANYLLEETDYFDLKVQNIVKACNVSASGVIRFCQYLGFKGFSELKYQLIHEIEVEAERNRHDAIIRESSDEHLKRISEAFQATHNGIDISSMEEIITSLHDADEIVVLGLGSSWIIAKDLELRFQRIKKNCRALNDVNLQYFAAKNAGKHSLFLGISYSGTTESTIHNLQIAGEEGAVTVLMTHYSNGHFDGIFDYLIKVYGDEGKGRRTSTICRLTMLYLVDMLYFMYMNHYMDEVSACLDYNSMIQNNI